MKNNLKTSHKSTSESGAAIPAIGDFVFYYTNTFPYLMGGKVSNITGRFGSGYFRIDFNNFIDDCNFAFTFPDIILNEAKGLILLEKLKFLIKKRAAQIESVNNVFNNDLAVLFEGEEYIPDVKYEQLISKFPQTDFIKKMIAQSNPN